MNYQLIDAFRHWRSIWADCAYIPDARIAFALEIAQEKCAAHGAPTNLRARFQLADRWLQTTP